MKFCYNTSFTLPKQSQRSRSVLQDRSSFLGLFWKGKILSYNQRNTVDHKKLKADLSFSPIQLLFCYNQILNPLEIEALIHKKYWNYSRINHFVWGKYFWFNMLISPAVAVAVTRMTYSCWFAYHISSDIRQEFFPSKTIPKI